MKRFLLITISFIFFGLAAFLILCPIVNNICAQKTVDDICMIPLPETTKMLETISYAGNLAGNGNGMQFFGAVLIESSLSIEELEEYYLQYREDDYSYIVEKQATQTIQAAEHPELSFRSEIGSKECYIVYSWGTGISPFSYFDVRGH